MEHFITARRGFARGTAVFAACLVMLAATHARSMEPAREPETDPLEGRWWVFDGREVKDEGTYFDLGVRPACGNAIFRAYPQRRVNFEPSRSPASKAVPWGVYSYKFDSSGVLTLWRPDGPSVQCFLRFRSEQMQRLDDGPPRPRPTMCVFQEGHRAFKLFRIGEEIAKLATSPEAAMGGPVFVPFLDILPGTWLVLPSQVAGSGSLEVRLDAPAPPSAMRFTVLSDNSAELGLANTIVRFRLRQTDPSHWAITPLLDVACATGTIVLERCVESLVGPSILVTRWRVAQRTMTAVLRGAEAGRHAPEVPALRFPGAEPLTIESLVPATARGL